MSFDISGSLNLTGFTTRRIIFIACILPVIALILCVALCLSTGACLGTDCTDVNFLPSLSAAISDEQPQRSIWMCFICISSSIRILLLFPVSRVYRRLCHTLGGAHLDWMVTPIFSLSTVEILFLSLLSLFPSATLYEAHRNCLAIFVFSSVMFMGFDTCLFIRMAQHSKNRTTVSEARRKSWLFASYLLLLTIIAAFYYVHTTYCPPYVYSLFSFFEYVAIVINVLYQYYANCLVGAVPMGVLLEHLSCSDKKTDRIDLAYFFNQQSSLATIQN
ncbi:hypothetical protein X801_06367 [Opisthorchis viverrini]|uniref:CWH43-like N-terminal domain-containing protein n=1 Tax=Opisthorchis viverrini TaxID=6198 RepID=A0A1S8WTN7_OPIVI|nr:hypothetical protein X801_06367 [Opisthorchis viverrini]